MTLAEKMATTTEKVKFGSWLSCKNDKWPWLTFFSGESNEKKQQLGTEIFRGILAWERGQRGIQINN